MTHEHGISGHTKTVGLIGYPIQHSLSPALHTTSFQDLGIDAVYIAYEVGLDQLEAATNGMKAMGFLGYNVTMPNKTYVHQYLDDLSDAARLMGAVNTVQLKDGKAIGHNTDGAGFLRSVHEAGIEYIGQKITLVGAGGAGSAIFVQAALDGAKEIDIYNRKDNFFEPAVERAKKVSEQTGCKIRVFDLAESDALKTSIEESVLLVNATSVGMGADCQDCLIPADFLAEGVAVADTIYEPRKTKLLQLAEEKGREVISGLGMLLWQAAIAEDIWVGKEMNTKLIEETYF